MLEMVLNEKQIEQIVQKVADKLNEFYKDFKEPVVFICVLKGAATFMHDLIKKIKFPLITDYIQVSSYNGTSSTGVIHLKKDISENIENKHTVIVEDIVDTGLTLKYLKQYLSIKHHPKDIKICSFIDKVNARTTPLEADFVGYKLLENKFLVGYGLDYNELLRNIPYVFVPTKEEIAQWDEIISKK